MSLEKEVFPFMAQDGELFAFDLEGKCAVMSMWVIYRKGSQYSVEFLN